MISVIHRTLPFGCNMLLSRVIFAHIMYSTTDVNAVVSNPSILVEDGHVVNVDVNAVAKYRAYDADDDDAEEEGDDDEDNNSNNNLADIHHNIYHRKDIFDTFLPVMSRKNRKEKAQRD